MSEAAHALRVSDRRVRAIIRSGVLPARRSGGRWLIRRADVEQRLRRRRRAGGPLSQAKAWALVLKCSGADWPAAMPAWDRSRLQRKLAEGSLLALASDLRNRAEPCFFRADARVVQSLSGDPSLVRSGVSASAAYGADVRAPGVFEGYVRRADLDALAYRYALRTVAPVDANVVLHSVDGQVPRTKEGIAPVAAVALDLLESDDPRAERAGRELARRCQ